jgi:hypothetical protein
MFSLALKNAILMILIILIIHFLIKNYLNNRDNFVAPALFAAAPAPAAAPPPFEPEPATKPAATLQEDEEELYKFVFNNVQEQPLNKLQGPRPQNSNLVQAQAQAQAAGSGGDLLGTFEKCNFGSPI